MAGRPRGFDEEEVLNRAMALFWQKGFDATGIADLESATGLGRQSLYGAFGDKRALFSKVVEHYFARVVQPGLVEVLEAPGSARGNLERAFALWEETALARDFNGCLVGNSVSELGLRDPEIARVLQRKLELMEEALYRTLLRAQAAGEVNARLDARATARALLTTAQGLAVVVRVSREKAFVQNVIGMARRLLD